MIKAVTWLKEDSLHISLHSCVWSCYILETSISMHLSFSVRRSADTRCYVFSLRGIERGYYTTDQLCSVCDGFSFCFYAGDHEHFQVCGIAVSVITVKNQLVIETLCNSKLIKCLVIWGLGTGNVPELPVCSSFLVLNYKLCWANLTNKDI